MKFKIDENLPVEVAELLRQHDHDAITVQEEDLSGEPDEVIASVCKQEGRILITLDNGFGDIRTFPPSEYFGIIILRVIHQDKPHILTRCKAILPLFTTQQIQQRLWIVEDVKVRIRE